MKLTFPMAAWVAFFAAPVLHAQNGTSAACPECAAKDRMIRELKAELARLSPAGRDESGAAATSTATLPAASGATYTVQPGDGLMKIARETGCSAADLASANGLTLDSVIQVGQVLKLPAGATTAAAAPGTPARAENTPPKTYTIKEGDTYYSLSRQLGVPLEALMAANPKIPATRLYEGRVIHLPAGASATGPAPAPAPQPHTPQAAVDPQAGEPSATAETKIVLITIEEEISYGKFASKHGTSIERLNSLNDLNLTSATILAPGSELHVPSAPAP